MKSITVSFHKEDGVEAMEVNILEEEDFNRVTEGGTRHLFELDTNIGFFVFFDGADAEGNLHYLVLQYEEDREEPTYCFSFELKDFYEFMALYLNDLEFSDEESEDEEQEYGAIHHLAHLLYHIVEDAQKTEL
ncbi:cytosolic protein [Bacillus nitroreducens]